MEDQRGFFNRIADQWDEITHHDAGKLQSITDLAEIEPGEKVLDVGTGTGVMIPHILSRVGESGRVTAIDVAEKMLAAAKDKFAAPNLDFLHGDIMSADLPLGAFDCIMCYSVFPHLGDKPGAVARLAGLLGPGGRLVIAHSESRRAINELHARSSEAISADVLPDMETISGYFADAGLSLRTAMDDETMFAAVGTR